MSDQPDAASSIRGRLSFIDALRGITIALMLLVNNLGGQVYYARAIAR